MALQGLNPILKKIVADPNQERAFAKARNWFNRVAVKKTEYGQGFVDTFKPVHDTVKGKYGGRLRKNRVAAKALVEKESELKNYIRVRQQQVGASKSGWAAALRSLPPPKDNNGQDGIPGARLREATWISGKMNVGGYNVSNFGERVVQITIVNMLGNVDGIADESNAVDLATANRIKQMPSQVKYRTKKVVDKFNNK